MGHHLFVNGSSVLPIRDGHLELVRHFLILGARDLGLDEAAKAIERWEWIGPGVWINIQTQALVDHPDIFDAAVRAVARFGETIDIAYLNSKLRRSGTEWIGPQKVLLIVDDIEGLKKHVHDGGAESTDF